MHATAYLKKTADQACGPIVVLFGGERFLKQAALRAICQKELGAAEGDDIGLVRIAGKDADLAEVTDALLTVSMWNPRQLVLVEEADEFVTKCRAGLEKYLERPAKKSVLVLEVKSWPSNTRLAKKSAEIGLPLDCGSLKPADLFTWLVEHARCGYERKLERTAAQRLVDLAGMDLALLDQELAKLASYVGEKGAIDTEAVEKLVGGWKVGTTWKMLDAVRDGQLGPALQLLDKLITAGEHPLKLLGGINYTYRQLAQATELSRQGQPLGDALAQAGVKPFLIQPATAYMKRIGRPRAEKLYRWLLQADLDVKGGSPLSERAIMERLLLQLAGKP